MTITVVYCIDSFQQVFNYVRVNKLVMILVPITKLHGVTSPQNLTWVTTSDLIWWQVNSDRLSDYEREAEVS